MCAMETSRQSAEYFNNITIGKSAFEKQKAVQCDCDYMQAQAHTSYANVLTAHGRFSECFFSNANQSTAEHNKKTVHTVYA